jgi:LmbE family N-acetylglucosaminyl deacetylase
MKNVILIILAISGYSLSNNAQSYKQLNSAEIYEELEKFNFLGTALYVAAHPDDENTRLISYMSNGLHARTAYLSLTRGDGGQNLIGTEIRELLGVIRSQELQMARATDGGQQFFTRANDFGYSKHPDETLEIWEKDKVMEDIVYAIRTFKPDIIVNRFDHRTPGKTHGHHTSSAMLSKEAFDLANDPNAYPHQVKNVGTWKVHRQFMNTSWWFYGSRENFAKADKTNLIDVDAGIYFPTLGISNGEISSLARSKHRSQGFGSAGSRGSQTEYLEVINGDIPKDKTNMFDGVNTTWTRVKGGEGINNIMQTVLENYDFRDPSAIVPQLLEIQKQLNSIQDKHWKPIKTEHLSEIIFACLGIHAEAYTDQQQATLNDSIEITMELTNRSLYNVSVKDIHINGDKQNITQDLEVNTQNKWFKNIFVDNNLPFSNPYWLDETGSLGIYKVSNPEIRNYPQSDAPLSATFIIDIEGQSITVNKDVVYKYVNPAEGEIRQPLAIVPPATMTFSKELYLFSTDRAQQFDVKVRASQNDISGTLQLNVPKGWTVKPTSIDFEIAQKSQENSYTFSLTPPQEISEANITAQCIVDGKTYDKTLINIDYDHIPLQTILQPAQSRIVKVPLNMGGRKIGYVMGAGDKMPESLTNVGYVVEEITPEEFNNINLGQYDAIVIGIRAYNTVKSLKLYNQALFDYAEAGGTVVTQYNTSRRLNYDDLAPYPLKLSRGRVTDEYADIRVLAPKHKVLNEPNKITQADFENWVQERGLYFASEWDEKYTAILSANDKGEDPLDGSLLVAEHGNGYFVYTSLSWFRQLPAGVPGAYRLFANILALSNQDRP